MFSVPVPTSSQVRLFRAKDVRIRDASPDGVLVLLEHFKLAVLPTFPLCILKSLFGNLSILLFTPLFRDSYIMLQLPIYLASLSVVAGAISLSRALQGLFIGQLTYQHDINAVLAVPLPFDSSSFCSQETKDGAMHLYLQVSNNTEAGLPLTMYLGLVFDSLLAKSASNYARGIA